MKKILLSFIVVIYFVFSCGIILNFHFCMGRFSSLEFHRSADKKCTTCGMHKDKDKKGCCHDEVKIIILQNDHHHSYFAYNYENSQPSLIFISQYLTVILDKEQITPTTIDHSPPLVSHQDTYLRNSVFRI